MSLAQKAVENRTVTIFTCMVFLVAGTISYFNLGQLEDPEFTIKTAIVSASYPGASALEVEQEVTDPIELAIQEMPQLKEIESFSRPGSTLIKVHMQSHYKSSQMPQIWDELRKKVRDMSANLPAGVAEPLVIDSFADVYGFVLAIVGDGYEYAELKQYAKFIKREMSLVSGVARVEYWGTQQECIYVELNLAKIASLSLNFDAIKATLMQHSQVVDGGGIDVQSERARFVITDEITTVEEVANLVISGLTSGGGELIRIRDIGMISRGYVQPAQPHMRYNGKPAIAIAISNVNRANIVDLGMRIDACLDRIKPQLPIGIEPQRIAWQSDEVIKANDTFMLGLLEAIIIVLLVLWISMGFRTAVIVGLCGLVFTIVYTFLVMSVISVDMQRMSLGALIIAMGMMVDNAIVVADGIIVRFERGKERVKAAVEAATQPSMPLLGATVIAVMAFYPIVSSKEGAGEYCRTLFIVVALSLMISWFLAVTLTPVLCLAWLKSPKPEDVVIHVQHGRMYRLYRNTLQTSMNHRYWVLLFMCGMLVAAMFGFTHVKQMFFPQSARPQLMLDFWMTQGTSIEEVSQRIKRVEKKLIGHPEIVCITTFVGQGPPRFYLPVEPEMNNDSYAQIIINLKESAGVNRLIDELQPWLDENFSDAIPLMNRYALGPGETWKVEARFISPGDSDPEILRELGEQALKKTRGQPLMRYARLDWRQQSKIVKANFNQNRARWAGISRGDVALTLKNAYDGITIGHYREGDEVLPIIARQKYNDRSLAAGQLDALQVKHPFNSQTIPLAQVVDQVELNWEDAIITRFNRRRMIAFQAVPKDGVLAEELRQAVKSDIESIKLPEGYELMWDGEYRSSRDAQASLIPGMVPAAVVMMIIIVALFNAYRPPLIIMLVVPLALIGVSSGLLLTGQPFGFMALLGLMSLSGMMIKNGIVLLDEVNIQMATGHTHQQAIMEAATSRLRPVLLAAGTTALGVIPLMQDVFWVSMAVTIMFGLAFGTILTMLVIPVLYATFYRLPVIPLKEFRKLEVATQDAEDASDGS